MGKMLMGRGVIGRRGAIGKETMGFGYILLLMIVGVGLVAGAGIYFGKEIDFRKIEAAEITGRIMQCISDGEVALEKINAEDELYKKCGIDKKVAENYFVIQVKKEGKIIFKWGDAVSCEFEGGKGNEFFPQCSRASFRKGGEIIEIVSGSKQSLRRGL